MVDRETLNLLVKRWCQVINTRQDEKRLSYVYMYENRTFMLLEKWKSASKNYFCVGLRQY